MAVNPLPPQAYTKDILQRAYTWLLTQNSSIKEMASTQDMLVSLYLKAQRSGDASLEAPSIQNFKQELKSLANLMGDLQTPLQTQIPQQSQQSSTFSVASSNPQTPTTTIITNSVLDQLDPSSLKALEDVKVTLNLSSEVEALRALLALGYKQFKKIDSKI